MMKAARFGSRDGGHGLGFTASDRQRRKSSESLLALISLGVVSCVVGSLVLGLVLLQRGRAAMDRSDEAFHAGELRESAKWAKTAALAYVPGSGHVRRAELRLSAIARGAEGIGDWDLARRAWDALRVVDEQTDYPGRGSMPSGQTAKRALNRLWLSSREAQGTTEIR